MNPQRKTREQLAAELVDLRASLEASRSECKRIDDRNGQLRASVDDLKERLAAAETENNRMRGYLDRVMEDDHEREQLVSIGEPGGEQQLVPKRKHRVQPEVYTPPGGSHRVEFTNWGHAGCERKPPRHWVNY